MKLTQEAFEEWKDQPVGEIFFKMLELATEQAKQHWTETSWNSGVCNPQKLASLKARAEAFEQMQAVTAQDVEEYFHEQQERRHADSIPSSG